MATRAVGVLDRQPESVPVVVNAERLRGGEQLQRFGECIGGVRCVANPDGGRGSPQQTERVLDVPVHRRHMTGRERHGAPQQGARDLDLIRGGEWLAWERGHGGGGKRGARGGGGKERWGTGGELP